MFETYKNVFNQRAESYHAAMLKYPRARKEELLNIVSLADIQDGDFVCDVPAGGAYLSGFIQKNVRLISIESSREFIKCGKDSSSHQRLLCEDIASLPLKSDSVDRVVSLAGIHHFEEKSSFYREICRLLKKGGVFALVDVMEHTPPAVFLNTFVDKNNSMGHRGQFLDEETKSDLEHAGFIVESAGSIVSYWEFGSVEEMADFYKMLFGMDRASLCQILEGVKEYLNFKIQDRVCRVKWDLVGFRAVKR